MELESKARSIAASTTLWQALARFEAPGFRLRIPTDGQYEAWLVNVRPGHTTSLRNGSRGCFTVLQASVWERVVDEQGIAQDRRYSLGDVRSFDQHLSHKLSNVGTVDAITLHLYGPLLMGTAHGQPMCLASE